MLMHASGEQSWWGSFIAKIMMEFFSTSQQSVFPQEKVFLMLAVLVFYSQGVRGTSSLVFIARVFVVLAVLCLLLGCSWVFMVLAVLAQHSPDVTTTVESLLTLLDNVLSKSGSRKMSGIDTRYVDFSLVGWILLLFAHVLDTCNGGNGSSDSSGRSSDKWDFIMPPPSIQTTPQTSSLTGYRQQRHKLRRQIVLHEKQLQELQKQQKKVMEVEGMQPSDVHHFQQAYLKSKFTSQALKGLKVNTYISQGLKALKVNTYISQGLKGLKVNTYISQGLKVNTYTSQGLKGLKVNTYISQGLKVNTYISQGLKGLKVKTYISQGLKVNTYISQGLKTQGETVTTTFMFPPKPVPANATPLDPPPVSPLLKLSSAIDARLELGVEMEAESDLKTLQVRIVDSMLYSSDHLLTSLLVKSNVNPESSCSHIKKSADKLSKGKIMFIATKEFFIFI
ncbi:predicted protein [Nematostella vectensis]|uniref:Uncharacterized protein n=1 Tax=Nematostella vectensis TaxID=45351 RepID=A7SVJ0_NEMVE|nr:predicted protein [Nematostella vectensis]|eukprot:XP_001624371.1 predicted protein [Nematostella vectensis]